ncbi:MAG: TIGR02300 family protein [Rhodospirillaceae bacterium]|nr:TIGR02300 family protein [Rhodospirillaceae bacterium]MBT4219006.1 TIGR02300 family protein [Rhodospirillaceae bacterium]MBT4464990.1 TIGR02300 family protein [Rhodospirillaceae bacterium]MBT5014433.1 TIGR02300 family protein [Rhodospirillaceae bacterium]MBT5562629.1 TIGR02300 family protein [Rhodospirillaceae bacterium]
MTKPALGTKRTCNSCEARFFDLKKNPPVCPKCGETIVVAKPAKPRREPAPAPQAAETPAATAETPAEDKPTEDTLADGAVDDPATDDDVEELEDDDENDDALIEDASDLGEDDDDVSEVLEHVDDGVGDK